MLVIKDDRARKLTDDYFAGAIGHYTYIRKMVDLINTITDERDYYRNKVDKAINGDEDTEFVKNSIDTSASPLIAKIKEEGI